MWVWIDVIFYCNTVLPYQLFAFLCECRNSSVTWILLEFFFVYDFKEINATFHYTFKDIVHYFLCPFKYWLMILLTILFLLLDKARNRISFRCCKWCLFSSFVPSPPLSIFIIVSNCNMISTYFSVDDFAVILLITF